MDALTALSVASSVLRFADFGSRLLSQSRQLYRSARDAPTASVDVELITADLLALEQDLRRRLMLLQNQPQKQSSPAVAGSQSRENKGALNAAGERCIGIAEELVRRLDRLRPTPRDSQSAPQQTGGRLDKWRMLLGADGLEALQAVEAPGMMHFSKWADFQRALEATWNRKDMESLAANLRDVRGETQFRIVVSFRAALGHLAGRKSQTSHQLRKATALVLDSFRNGQEALASQIKLQAQKLLQLHQAQRDSEDGAPGVSLADALHAVGTLQSPRDGLEPVISPIRDERLENEIRLLLIESCILDSLSFATMMDRRESVERAHARTFDWIYKDALAEDVPWSNFVDWLRQGTGIYWINGKAGSGKSTLMRYLYENNTTRRELKTWAAGLPCEVYGFFFWNSGDEDQKSQHGLLKSLLFEILQRHQYLMPDAMPGLWEAWRARADSALKNKLPRYSPLLPPEPEPLTMSQLKSVFQHILQVLSPTTKLFFLIDGLDEYGGNFSDIVSFFKQCAASPNIKLCLSSRPLKIFVNSFAGLPTLRLQDLTHDDLTYYVQDRLSSHMYALKPSQNRATEASNLIRELVSKPQGVFLWVSLVVRCVLQKFAQRKSMSDILSWVQRLPGDLEELYAHMLEETNPQRASQIFQLFRMAQRCSPQKVTLLQLSWADEDDELLAEEAPMQRITTEEISLRCQAMDTRLKVMCAGLLESIDDRFSSMAPNGKVIFLHRTVSDWTAKPDVWHAFTSRTANTGFSAAFSMLKSCILHVKSMDVSPSRPLDMGVVANALEYAKEAEADLNAGFPKLLDQLDLAAAYQYRLGSCRAVYEGDDNISDASDDTIKPPASDGSSSPGEPLPQLVQQLQSYRTSLTDGGAVFGTMEETPASLLQSGMNELSASYMAHTLAKYQDKMHDAAPQPVVRPRKQVGHLWYHWTYGLELPGLKAINTVSTFYDVTRLLGLTHYVAAKDMSANVLDQDVSQHMLMRAVSNPAAGVDVAMIERLLSGGTDPNFAYQGQTPWEAALAAAASRFAAVQAGVAASSQQEGGGGGGGSSSSSSSSSLSLRDRQDCESWAKVLQTFLQHDADPYAEAKLHGVLDRAVVSVCAVLESYVPGFLDDEAIALMELLRDKREQIDKRNEEREMRIGSVDAGQASVSLAAEWPMSWKEIRK